MSTFKASWSDVDVLIRKCNEAVLEGHRWVKQGCHSEGLRGPLHFVIACIELRDRLDKIIGDRNDI